MMTTNCSESFGGVLKCTRALPIQDLVARTFYRTNRYFYKRREDEEKGATNNTPMVEELLKSHANNARFCRIARYNHTNWTIYNKNENVFGVELLERSCSCTCNIWHYIICHVLMS